MFRKKKSISFILDVCVEEDGSSFHAFCPALEGVHVDGETKDEAVRNAALAATIYIKSLMKHGDPIPLQVRIEETQEVCKTGSGKALAEPCHPRQTENILVTV